MSPRHLGGDELDLSQRMRDIFVAEAIAAEAGTDATPELLQLSPIVSAVIPLQPRPPLASSGYFPGTVSIASSAVALNTSHAGIFGSGVGRSICRVNWIKAYNTSGGALTFILRRLDSPFTGFPSVALVPGYINAGNPVTNAVFSITKSDTVAAQGVSMGSFRVEATSFEQIDGPWILNNGGILLAPSIVNTSVRFSCGYEVWPAIRTQG